VIILDTNVISELFRVRPEPNVIAWLEIQDPLEVYTTVITEAEVLYGIERLPSGKRKQSLEAAVRAVLDDDFGGRVLPFDSTAARILPKLVASRDRIGRPMSQFDAVIAAITKAHGALLATRNTADFEHCGIRIENPWSAQPSI
jgi:toxin FitB